MEEIRKLEFKESTELLGLEELKQTVKAKEAGIKKKIDHFQVFDDVREILYKNNIRHSPGDIVAKGGHHAKRIEIAEKYVGEKVLPAWYLGKVSGNIILDDTQDIESSMRMRIEYCDRGITLSIGKHIIICENGMTAFKGEVVSSYGSNKLAYDDILNVTRGWISDLDDKNNAYNKLITSMKEIPVEREAIPNTIGNLQMLAVGNAYNKGEDAPLNIGQVSSFTKNIIEAKEEEEKLDTLWQLYNLATSIQKPNKMDMSMISKNNYALTNFFIDKYNIPLESEKVA